MDIKLTHAGFQSVGRLQYALHAIYARIEPLLLRIVDYLITKRTTETYLGQKILFIIAWASYLFPYGIVASPDAAMRLVDHIERTEVPKRPVSP